MKKSQTKSSKMSFKEFIENHLRVLPEGKHIELTPMQYAFIDFLEENKGKNVIWLKSRIGGVNYITKLYKEYLSQDIE